MGLDTSVFDSPRLKNMFKGIARVHGNRTVAPRRQLTFDVLDSIIPYCDKSFDDTCLKTALCVAFAAFLRGGDFTYSGWGTIEQATKPTRAAVQFHQGYATITLPRTKTEDTPTTIRILETRRSSCPVTSLKDLFERFPAPDHAPLFARWYPSAPLEGKGYFTAPHFAAQMEGLLLRAGIDPKGFSNHSIRRGAAQSAADAGLNKNDIQILGRWKGEAVLKYVTPASAAALGKAKPQGPRRA